MENFHDWKIQQLELGNLVMASNSHSGAYPYATKSGWGEKWAQKKLNASSYGHPFSLTIDEFLELCYDANLSSPTDIGLQKFKYQLGRIGDKGGYTKGNCRYITSEQNLEEKILNGGIRRSVEKRTGVSVPSMRGEGNYQFLGWYHAPNGKFSSKCEAGKSNGCSSSAAFNRCKTPDRVINRRTANMCVDLNGHEGKTYRDLGWYFEPSK